MMLVFKVRVEEVDDTFAVTCRDFPTVHHPIDSLWEACTVRHVLARQARVPDDLIWLQIHARVGAMTIVSDVHPLHWMAFHSVSRPAHPAFDRSQLVFDQALTALRHESGHAVVHGRSHAQVKVILSFLSGTKLALPRSGGFLLREVVEGTRSSGDLSAWVRAHTAGLPDAEGTWRTPVVGVQVGVFGPEASTARRYR